MNNAFIIDGIRTPIGNFGGMLATTRPDDLAALVIKTLVQRNPAIDVQEIYGVLMGCANQAGEDNRNIARMALLMAGLPLRIPGETINCLCASGLSAAIIAARTIQTGDAALMIAGGVESMTRGPWVISKTTTPFGRDAQMFDSSFGWRFINPLLKQIYGVDTMGETAENLAAQYHISREHQDAFAYRSHQKAAKAQAGGRFNQEIIGVSVAQKKGDATIFTNDEFIKPGTTLELLAKLRTAFAEKGTVTAGNAAGLNDGAAALLLASSQAVKQYQLKPLARIVASGIAGVEPRIMGIGPVPAAAIALKKAGLTMADMDLIELNEAFAAQSLACLRSWNIADDDTRVNPNGGAIALGHPLGMSGARILLTAALELQLQQKKFALITMCVGVGQGYAVIIERM